MTSPNHSGLPPSGAGTDHHTVARYVAARGGRNAAIEEMALVAAQHKRRLRQEDQRVG